MMLAAPLRIRYVHGLILNSSTASQNLAPIKHPSPLPSIKFARNPAHKMQLLYNMRSGQHVKWPTDQQHSPQWLSTNLGLPIHDAKWTDPQK